MGAMCEEAIAASAKAVLDGGEDALRLKVLDIEERTDAPGARHRGPVHEPAAAAAARGKRPAHRFLGAEDGLRHGAHRRPGPGYRGAGRVYPGGRGRTAGKAAADGKGEHKNGHGERGLLCEKGRRSRKGCDGLGRRGGRTFRRREARAHSPDSRRAFCGGDLHRPPDGGQIFRAHRRPRHQYRGMGGIRPHRGAPFSGPCGPPPAAGGCR
jgi:hypothetical protein